LLKKDATFMLRRVKKHYYGDLHDEEFFMKSIVCIFGIGAVMLTSCENKAETGALVGAGVGIGAGALISPTPAGVLIGGAVGAVGGALIGAALDSADRDTLQRESPRTMNKIDRGEQLSMKDIERMSQAGITDDKIVGAIHSTGSVYHLSSSDVQELKDNGVSQRVIDFMLQTPYQ
jgi:osmotically inducible lipoprotein OsmB